MVSAQEHARLQGELKWVFEFLAEEGIHRSKVATTGDLQPGELTFRLIGHSKEGSAPLTVNRNDSREAREADIRQIAAEWRGYLD